jgi:hypothetical protein
MERTKTTGFYFKCSPEEMNWIERRMAQLGIKNKSAFLRKMAIDGYVINLDLSTLNEIGKLLRNTANNINQLAKHVNSGSYPYREDVKEINAQLAEIRGCFGEVLSYLSKLDNTKPSKSNFVKPMTIRDLPEYNQGEGE